jgi:hypothetical protein
MRNDKPLTLSAGLDQDTEMSLPLVQSLGTLPQTTGESVVNESVLEDLLKGVLDRHGTLGRGGDLDVVDDDLFRGSGSRVGTSVRHFYWVCGGLGLLPRYSTRKGSEVEVSSEFVSMSIFSLLTCFVKREGGRGEESKKKKKKFFLRFLGLSVLGSYHFRADEPRGAGRIEVDYLIEVVE